MGHVIRMDECRAAREHLLFLRASAFRCAAAAMDPATTAPNVKIMCDAFARYTAMLQAVQSTGVRV